jgi:hypothetical protein
MKSTTKSCSTYLSANLLHLGHCVNRTSAPAERDFLASPPPLVPSFTFSLGVEAVVDVGFPVVAFDCALWLDCGDVGNELVVGVLELLCKT